MKATLGILGGLLFTTSVFAQGLVVFANTASTQYRIWTNNAAGTASNLISGINAYRFGLYAAQGVGQTSNSLSLVGVATNVAALPGFFSAPAGGNFAMPAPFAGGDSITFQIHAWTLSAGNSYEEAVIASQVNPMNVAMGISAIGTTMLTGSPAPPAALFGTAPGLLSTGFYISAAPEPSTWALLGLGAAAMVLFSRRRTR